MREIKCFRKDCLGTVNVSLPPVYSVITGGCAVSTRENPLYPCCKCGLLHTEEGNIVEHPSVGIYREYFYLDLETRKTYGKEL